ncbi:MAG: DUF4919 domain-containing protein [Rikenellaceae bacterium]
MLLLVRKIFVAMCVALCVAHSSFAKVPDDDNILLEITTPQSENYYPNLMMRFMYGDTTLTRSNYHYLYYGFAFDDRYKPLETISDMDTLLELAAQLDVKNLSGDRDLLGRIVTTGERILVRDPFNPKVWNLMAFAYGGLGDKEKEVAAYKRVESILATILESGDGTKQRSPRHVLMFDHALDLLAAQNLHHLSPKIVSRTVEYIPLMAPRSIDGEKVRGYFFDFGRVYRNKPDSVTYKRDRTWQFNNLPVREYK